MKICIAGDSWGCGEWRFTYIGKHKVSHPGLGGYLSHDHEVVNVSKGGCSNFDSIDLLKNALMHHEFDVIFWIKTDPLRDANTLGMFDQVSLSLDNLFEFQLQATVAAYSMLADLNVKIYCLGGCSPLLMEKNQRF